MFVEAMSIEEHKKKVAKDATLKVLVNKESKEIPEVQRKTTKEATTFAIDGEPVPEEVIIESM